MLLDMVGHLAPSAAVFEEWCLHYRFARVFAVCQDVAAVVEAVSDGLSQLFGDGRAREMLARGARVYLLIDGRKRLPAQTFEPANPLWTAPFQAIPEGLFFRPR